MGGMGLTGESRGSSSSVISTTSQLRDQGSVSLPRAHSLASKLGTTIPAMHRSVGSQERMPAPVLVRGFRLPARRGLPGSSHASGRGHSRCVFQIIRVPIINSSGSFLACKSSGSGCLCWLGGCLLWRPGDLCGEGDPQGRWGSLGSCTSQIL